MHQHQRDILRYLLRMPGERAAQVILLGALSLEPGANLNVVMEAALGEKRRLGPMEWSSSVARVNLLLRQHLEWDMANCERLLSAREAPTPTELVSVSRVLLRPWQLRHSGKWEPWADCEPPPWHDLSQGARLKLMQVFLGLLGTPLDTPYEPEVAEETSWTLRYLATMLVGSSALQRGSFDLDGLASLFAPGQSLTPEVAADLSEIVTAAGANQRIHSPFIVEIPESWLN